MGASFTIPKEFRSTDWVKIHICVKTIDRTGSSSLFRLGSESIFLAAQSFHIAGTSDSFLDSTTTYEPKASFTDPTDRLEEVPTSMVANCGGQSSDRLRGPDSNFDPSGF